MLFAGAGCSDASGSGAGVSSSGDGAGCVLDGAGADEALPALSGGLVCSGVAGGFCSEDAAASLEAVPGRLEGARPSADPGDWMGELPLLEADGPSGKALSLRLGATEDVPEAVPAESSSEEETAASGGASDRQPVMAPSKAASKTKRILRMEHPSQLWNFSSLLI